MGDHVIDLKERFVLRKEKGSEGVYSEADKKEVYLTDKVTTDYTSILCREEGWKEEDGTRLLVPEWVNGKK